ncbi:MAG: cell division protein FtsK [Blastococcus sp.]|jgi:S-DNA-T family DNA segregation ATPase FtsK/SpoIIIE|nr:cell division protein FtsK [Blastococcus sp.]
MRLEFSLTSKRGHRRTLVAEAAPAATLGQVLADRLDPGDVVFGGARPLDLERPVGQGGLRSGAELSVGYPGEDRPWPLDGPALAVVGGAAAATLVPLRPGTVTIGRAEPADVVLDDPTLSTRHAELQVGDDGSARIRDVGSSNGTFVRGTRLAGGKGWTDVAAGERFLLGQAVLTVLSPARPDGSVDITPDGQARFNRVTRYRTADPAVRVSLPAAPPDPGRSGLGAQLIGSGAMLVVGIVTAAVLGNYLYALIGVIAPLVFMGTAIAAQGGQRRDAARRRREYDEARKRAEGELTHAATEEMARAWGATADPAVSALAARGPTSDLWSVDGHDDTAMLLRVGTADRPARITVQDAGKDAPAPWLAAAPVTVDLRSHPVLGIAGDELRARAAARAVVHQLVTARSPEDLLVVHLDAAEDNTGWEWLRWLPHVRGMDAEVHAVSPGADALTARFDELTALLNQRRTLVEFGFGPQLLLPEVLVVLDGAGALRTRQSLVTLLRDGPALGVRILALDAVAARLPAEASARLVIDPQATGGPIGFLEVRGEPTVQGITVDLLSTAAAETSARALAPLVPLGGVDGAGLRDSVRFTDLYRLDAPTPADVLARWGTGGECQVVLGIDENGRPATIDLVRDGPHALVAGTSGAGKSELLRSLLAGLALSAPPADLSLLLIDFKGGGAFGKLQDLPHVVGYADDQTIAGHLADRLLASLRAELDVRKNLFKNAGNVDGLAEYRSARRRSPELPSVSRLVIVVDEFAELKEQQPDFVDGLVNVARVGRSLGVHLILATQRPTGVVTPQIRDNANLRICLRVLDAGVSHDLVGSAVAASFPHRIKGRTAVLVGEGQPLVVQTGYVSAPVRTAARDEVPPPRVRSLPWRECGLPEGRGHRAEGDDAGRTDLTALCDVIGKTALQQGLHPARRPWLPPLGELVLLPTLLEQTAAGPSGWAPFGVEDKPAEQRQTAFGLRLGGGNLAVVGGRGSGRSTALRSLAASLAARHTPDQLHLYVIDQTTASVLRPLARLPHCGVVATRAERHRTERLVARLSELLDERSALLARTGVGSLAELRGTDPGAPPHVVVLVDGWDQLVQAFQGVAEGLRLSLVRLAEEGPAAGIQLVVAGGKAVMQSRLYGTMESVLVLRFEQREDMAGFGVPIREVPEELLPGRAHRPGSGNAVQVALLAAEPGTEEQNAALTELAAAAPPPQRHVPLRLDDLPTRITWAEAAALPGAEPAGPRTVLVGVGGDQLTARTVDLDRLPGIFTVAGPAGSGRTATLVLMARQLAARGVPVMVAPGREEDVARFTGVQVVDPRHPMELIDGAVVLVDDAGRVPDDAALLHAALDHSGVRLVLAAEPTALSGYVGWKGRVQNGMSGLLFSAKAGDGVVIGSAVSIEEAFTAGPGRAYLGGRGQKQIVQVPWAG